ncbi:Lysophospholipase L1 [Mycolicibacterium rutilum]|uniref:Lysophospholipase L1 n=1 Tax=Mycolicibacterium rutilum TaxID=370526 RepID=A0A1H6IQR3_MYCRU|nr:GDSL-type esterase/lipase family protein [Mycolicibacterium rutilum]SEH48631.1 Lysophospholipase L1 [Mycolicibacterium rutilum]
MSLRLSCIGDSITRAQLSVDYVAPLIRQHPGALAVERFGVNGDFAYNLLHRLDPVVATPADAIAVLIGTNDARASVPGYPISRSVARKGLPRPPSRDWFAECLAAIVERLHRETDARIALLSLPALGQILDAAPMRAAAEYSGTIADVAKASGVTYLPLYERQVAALRSRQVAPVPYRELTAVGYLATLARQRLGRDLDAISRRRRLELTTDHIHQNSRGAALIADEIDDWLRGSTLRPQTRLRQRPSDLI